jgi:hypothetical protein
MNLAFAMNSASAVWLTLVMSPLLNMESSALFSNSVSILKIDIADKVPFLPPSLQGTKTQRKENLVSLRLRDFVVKGNKLLEE